MSCILKIMGILKKNGRLPSGAYCTPDNHLLFADGNFLFFKAYIGAGVEVNNAFQA
jgi:hypothetical protein